MKDYRDEERTRLEAALGSSSLDDDLPEYLQLYDQGWQKILKHGDLPRWKGGFHALPDVIPSCVSLEADILCIGKRTDILDDHYDIESSLKAMHPWRKGPFDVFGVYIDTEWRSDWKWQRVLPHITPLKGRTVLDVGCGSGYHMWRMLGAAADLVLGVDPTPLFSMHFATMKRYVPDANAFLLPVGIDDIPQDTRTFDSVFSMGILYHRRSPLDHLMQLKGLLGKGGELVLETLVIEGDENACLMPKARYAKMRNVWFIPSVSMLVLWLQRCGFKNIRCVDKGFTSLDEQRRTEWMNFESLADFLDPQNRSQTIEGYPAPMRAVILAEAP
ncbi:MAG: tRNA 5-methoxyuridine(34)/uridine 5-oxyacetic acid(34) synthase CmoB [Mariprofundaceae bacterium]|nr:tRNA 5-methoxyuridine(34)/uridine 5-oxyacetic acid(34) synthase CmoB [Mariprofundaceae bacterium]